ncbi:IS1 family transposase [Candidatus Bandiella euplotis]|uniref:IS1 family transposase n=1 Tax=Candidatus Bandiella euplotis TaxID=1664265 RepID=A0ABZ0UL52_9RICK|nr:IS1 family transposase [Candidatus Bandiella woodruffii]
MVGKRNVTTFRKLWKIISRDNCTYYTDDWSVYSEVIPRHQHVVGKQHTLSIESNNSNTRHRIARMTRKTKVVSKSEEVVDLTIKLWVHFEDNNNFLSEQGNFISILWQHSGVCKITSTLFAFIPLHTPNITILNVFTATAFFTLCIHISIFFVARYIHFSILSILWQHSLKKMSKHSFYRLFRGDGLVCISINYLATHYQFSN